MGLVLVAAFSLYLTAVLVGVGLALVAGRDLVARRGWLPAISRLPQLSGVVLAVLGLVLMSQGLRDLG